MAEGLFWFLLLVCGFQAPLKAVGLQIVAVPSESQQTQEFILSQQLQACNFSGTVAPPDDSKGFGIKTKNVSATHNLQVCGTVNLNKIVDEMLASLRADIIKQGKDRIDIPDLHETFEKKVGFIKFKGEFDGLSGWAKNLSTVYRTADVVASSYGNRISVSCGFGLGDLEVGYETYTAKFLILKTHGKISGSVGVNSILLNATVTLGNRTCNITLNELSLNKFGGLVVRVTGLGAMSWLFSRISTWTVHHFESVIKGRLEHTLREETETYLSHFNCSKYFPKL